MPDELMIQPTESRPDNSLVDVSDMISTLGSLASNAAANYPQWKKDLYRNLNEYGGRLFEADYGQIEVVMQAHRANCKGLIDLFNRGEDPHTSTASRIFGIPYDVAKQSKYRKPVKCFHPDTEVLTHHGWRRIVDLIGTNEEIIQAIPGDDGEVTLEWVVPTDIHTDIHPSNKLAHIERENGINLRVTPDHRNLVWRAGQPYTYTGYEVVTPHGLRYMDSRSPTYIIANAGILKQESGVWIVDSRIIQLSVAVESAINAGLMLPEEIPLVVKDVLDSDGSFSWRCLDLTEDLRSLLLSLAEIGKHSRKSVDVLQSIAAITGVKSTINTDDSGYLDTYGPFTSKSNSHSLTVTEYEYRGNVACISVPSTFVLVRDRGITVISGNSANFGVIYMISAEGLSSQINEYIADLILAGEPVDVEPWSVEKCEKFIAEWYKLYPEVKEYQMRKAAQARRYGYVTDMFGRRRFIPEVFSPIKDVQEAGIRQAANMDIQSSSQGVAKISMGNIWKQLPGSGYRDKARFLMQIHDSLVGETLDIDEVSDGFLRWMCRLMVTAVKLVIPIKVEVKTGYDWRDTNVLFEMSSKEFDIK